MRRWLYPERPVEGESELQRRERFDRTLRRLVVAILGLAFLVGAGTGSLALRNAARISKDERTDRDALRVAGWRGCMRDMQERADFRVLLMDLIDGGARGLQPILDRQGEQLPILECDHNLCGSPPRMLPLSEQREFIQRYRNGDLPANPTMPEPVRCENGMATP
jgi:hypothetical protein